MTEIEYCELRVNFINININYDAMYLTKKDFRARLAAVDDCIMVIVNYFNSKFNDKSRGIKESDQYNELQSKLSDLLNGKGNKEYSYYDEYHNCVLSCKSKLHSYINKR